MTGEDMGVILSEVDSAINLDCIDKKACAFGVASLLPGEREEYEGAGDARSNELV